MGSGEVARVLRSSSRIQAELVGGDFGFWILDFGLGSVASEPRPLVAALEPSSPSRMETRRRAMYWRTRGIWILGMSSMDLRTFRGTRGSKPYQYMSGR